MRNIILLLIAVVLLQSCSSIDLPSIEQSQADILKYSAELKQDEAQIKNYSKNLPEGSNLVLNIKLETLNKVIEKVTSNRVDDITIILPPKKQIMNEEKNVFGIKYSNYLNIDTGNVKLDLKKLKFDKFENNKIYATLEIEGSGNVKISGKYTGIPASVNPDIVFYMYETFTLDANSVNGVLILKPNKKTLKLKTKISIKLLEWSVPYYQEIPLEITDLIKPISFPLSVPSQIMFPLPSETFSNNRLEFAPFNVELKGTSMKAHQNIIDYRTDIEFKRHTK